MVFHIAGIGKEIAFCISISKAKMLCVCSYVHGSPLLESSNAFEPHETGERIAAALGRVFLLDLVIRNEDRLPLP